MAEENAKKETFKAKERQTALKVIRDNDINKQRRLRDEEK
jgi:hypothetical protein